MKSSLLKIIISLSGVQLMIGCAWLGPPNNKEDLPLYIVNGLILENEERDEIMKSQSVCNTKSGDAKLACEKNIKAMAKSFEKNKRSEKQ
jgi:hypothetical protein